MLMSGLEVHLICQFHCPIICCKLISMNMRDWHHLQKWNTDKNHAMSDNVWDVWGYHDINWHWMISFIIQRITFLSNHWDTMHRSTNSWTAITTALLPAVWTTAILAPKSARLKARVLRAGSNDESMDFLRRDPINTTGNESNLAMQV